ncbi:hypothetical protein EON83_21240 [bacterium]|nr:MAG: hypothetical protein EON83_21240 [bacterium]
MKLVEVRGDILVSWASDYGFDVFIKNCATQEEFEAWCGNWPDRQLAMRYQDTVYVKVPFRLDSYGEFCLDYDVLPVPEANARITLWNERYRKWLVV